MLACLNAGLLARSDLHPEGPATGQLDYGFSDFRFPHSKFRFCTQNLHFSARVPLKTDSTLFAKTQSSQRDQNFVIMLPAKNEKNKK